MREGLLWFSNNTDYTLAQKIGLAAQFYYDRYGMKPTLCFVNPVMLADEKAEVEGIEIRATHSVLPNHFWIGATND